jgi:hypothetical protein
LNTKREPVEMSVADASDERPLASREIAERRALEQDLVVEVRGELRAAPARRIELAPIFRD